MEMNIYRRKRIYKKRTKDRKYSGWHLIEDIQRYEYEVKEYKERMNNVFPKSAMYAASIKEYIEYLSFTIDILIKEVKYSSLLEINRGNSRDRFIYPFFKFDLEFIGLPDYKNKVFVDIDIEKGNVISSPWNRKRYIRGVNYFKENDFKYDKKNHMAYYYDYLNITCAYNGIHSLGIGACNGRGTIKAEYYDTVKLFQFIEANDDLSFTYNKKNTLEYMKKNNIPITHKFKEDLNSRVYGTDYRMMIIYELAKLKYELENR